MTSSAVPDTLMALLTVVVEVAAVKPVITVAKIVSPVSSETVAVGVPE